MRRSQNCGRCRGSANAPRNTSRCASCANRMHSPPPTSACCARWRTPTAYACRPRNYCRAQQAGGHGAPMRRCICGQRTWRHRRRLGESMNAKPPETFGLDRLQTPIGVALLVVDKDGVLRALDWEDHEPRMRQLLRRQYGAVTLKQARAPRDLRSALAGYFKGDLDRLTSCL